MVGVLCGAKGVVDCMIGISPDAAPVCRLVRSGRVWQCDDDLGISRCISYALAQDQRGYLWVGTEDGPVLFDGLVWSTPPGLRGLDGCIVRALAWNSRFMYLGTDGTGLRAVDVSASPYQVAPQPAGTLPSTRVHTVCVGQHEELWAGTHGGLVLVRQGGVVSGLSMYDRLPEGPVWGLCQDQQQRLWVAMKRGLALIDEQAVQWVGLEQGVHQVCCDAAGRIWAALVGGAIMQISAEGHKPVQVLQAQPGGPRVRALCPDERGRVWVGTNDGVRLLEGGELRDSWTRADGMPAKEVWALTRDGEGRTWAGTMTGVVLVSDSARPVRSVAVPEGITIPPVYACAFDGQDRIWLGAETGLLALDVHTASAAAVSIGSPVLDQESIWSVITDQRGRLWCGTDGKGLLCLDVASGRLVTHVAPTRHVPVLCLEGKSYLWAGMTGYGLVRVDIDTGEPVLLVSKEGSFSLQNVQGLQFDRGGQLWVGTWSGNLAALDPRSGSVQQMLVLWPRQ